MTTVKFNMLKGLVIGGVTLTSATLASAAEEGGAAMPQLDFATYPSQLFWLAVTFAVLFVLMWKVALPRVGDVIEARDKKISDDLARAENARAEIDAISADIEKTMAAARSDAQDVLRAAAEKVAAGHAKKQAKIEADISQRIVDAEESIAAAQKTALDGLRDVAQDVAASSVEKLTGRTAETDELKAAFDAIAEKGA